MKEIRPSEIRAWELKYEKWFRCSLQGQPPAELEVDTFLSLVDPWWPNRLQPKCEVETQVRVREEMRILYPISRRRDILFECRQKSLQYASEYYLELKDLGEDCLNKKMDYEALLSPIFARDL